MKIWCDRPCFRALITQVIASSLQKALFWVLPQLASLSGTFGQQFSTGLHTGHRTDGAVAPRPSLQFASLRRETQIQWGRGSHSIPQPLPLLLSRGCWAPVWAAERPACLLSSTRPQRDCCFTPCYVPAAWTQCGGHGAALGPCWVMLQHQKAPGGSTSTADRAKMAQKLIYPSTPGVLGRGESYPRP